MSRYKKRGWFGEPHRHYLAAKGIKTKRTRKYMFPLLDPSLTNFGVKFPSDEEDDEEEYEEFEDEEEERMYMKFVKDSGIRSIEYPESSNLHMAVEKVKLSTDEAENLLGEATGMEGTRFPSDFLVSDKRANDLLEQHNKGFAIPSFIIYYDEDGKKSYDHADTLRVARMTGQSEIPVTLVKERPIKRTGEGLFDIEFEFSPAEKQAKKKMREEISRRGGLKVEKDGDINRIKMADDGPPVRSFRDAPYVDTIPGEFERGNTPFYSETDFGRDSK